jgi:gas vesicle protein
MAYEYDRFEREDSSGSFLMGLLAGTVLGAGLGMLFAPKTGSELRTQLGEQAGKLKTTAADGYNQATEKVSQIVDRGREAYERARSNVNTGMTGSNTGVGTTSGTTGTSGNTSSGNTGAFTGAGAGTGGYSTNRT